MVVLKCIGINSFYLERVVMPTEVFLFTAPVDARVELWRLGQGGQICQERSDVTDFQLDQSPSPQGPTPDLHSEHAAVDSGLGQRSVTLL